MGFWVAFLPVHFLSHGVLPAGLWSSCTTASESLPGWPRKVTTCQISLSTMIFPQAGMAAPREGPACVLLLFHPPIRPVSVRRARPIIVLADAVEDLRADETDIRLNADVECDPAPVPLTRRRTSLTNLERPDSLHQTAAEIPLDACDRGRRTVFMALALNCSPCSLSLTHQPSATSHPLQVTEASRPDDRGLLHVPRWTC